MNKPNRSMREESGTCGHTDKSAGKNRYLIVVIVLCFLVFFIANYPMYQLSPIAESFKATFGLDNTQYSSIFSSPMIPGVLLSIVAGLIVDKVGPRRAVLFAMIITTIGMFARIGAGDYWSMLACMISLGIGATAINVSGPKIIMNWAGPARVGSLVGVVYAGATMSMAVGMGTTAFFPSITSAFMFAAILCALFTILWMVFMKDRPDDIRKGTKPADAVDAGQGPIREAREDEGPSEKISVVECLKSVVKTPAVWIIGLCLFGAMGGTVGLSAFLPSALASVRGFSITDAGLMSALIMVGTLIGNIAGPFIEEKVGHTKPFLMVVGLACAVLIATAWLAPAGPLLLFALLVTGFALGTLTPILIALPVRSGSIEPAYVGTAQGVCSTLMTLGAIVVPTYIISPIAGSNYTLVLVLAGCSLLVVVAALAFLHIRPSSV